MATMGVLHDYNVAEYCIICRAGTMGGRSTHSAWWLLAIIDLPESWYRASAWRRWGVLHGYYVTEHRIICRDGAKGDTQPTLIGGCQRI